MNTPWQITESGIKSFQCEGWTVTVWPEGSMRDQLVQVQEPEMELTSLDVGVDNLYITNPAYGIANTAPVPWSIVEAIMEARSIVAGRTL